MTDEIDVLSEAVIKAVREYDRRRHSEKIKYAMALMKLRGFRLGRPPVYGAEDIERLVRLRAAGKSYRKIAAETGIPHKTVHELVTKAVREH